MVAFIASGPGSLTVSNSTISENSAGTTGGAIFGGGSITNCTISGNTASQGGGSIYVTSALQIGNTILNAGANGANILNGGGTVTSHGYNVSSDDGGGFLTAPGDQINTVPMLGPLQDNGGPTFTQELLPGSPAINTGDPNFTPPPLYDQRGPGYDRVFAGRLDIGSFEVQSILPTPTPTPTATATGTPCEGFTEVYHQYFDGNPPALPPGWVATNPVNPDGIFWEISNSGGPQPPSVSGNAAFINDPGSISDKLLDSPLLGQFMPPQQLSFENNYSLQSGFDGGVLEISITGVAGDAFRDIITAGGSFISGGYNGTISTSSGSPIAGRMAWTGSSNGFMTTTVNLPGSVGIQTFKLRWRMASDNSTSGAGWRIDNVVIYGFFSTPCPQPTQTPTPSATATATVPPTPTPTPTP